jgi:hypothetical protein
MSNANAKPASRRSMYDQQRLSPGEEPPIGAHVVTPRRAYDHHGIYVGGGRVIHYRAVWHGLRGGCIEETPLKHFGKNRPVYVRRGTPAFEAGTVVHRAYARVGERRYRLLTNNCEHLCEWCLRGRARSAQVELLRALPRNLVTAFTSAAGKLANTAAGVLRPKGLAASHA